MRLTSRERPAILLAANHAHRLDLALLLDASGLFDIIVAASCTEAIAAVRRRCPQAIVCGLELEDDEEGGLYLCTEVRAHETRQVRQACPPIPIIVLLSAADARIEADCIAYGATEVAFLSIGVDELAERLPLLLGLGHVQEPAASDRGYSHAGDTTLPCPIEFTPNDRRVVIDGRVVRLSKTEALLLNVLAVPPGRTVSRQDLLASVWECHITSTPSQIWMETRLVDGQIAGLRRKLRPYNTLIASVRGVGYKLDHSPCSPGLLLR